MVLTDWLRRRSFARGQAHKRCRHGEEMSRWCATVSRQVEALEHRHLLTAVQPDWVSLMAFGGDYGPFQVTMSPLTQPELAESSAATFAGRTQFQTAGIQQSMQGDDFVAVDVSQTYAISGWAKSGDEFGQRFDPANRQSFGIAEYDSDHLVILPIHVLKFAGATDTTLAVALNPGDTQIRLVNAIGWSNSVGESAATRALAWYGYTNSSGQTYADYSYTRHVATGGASGLWAAGSVNLATNTITLNAPWTGPAMAAGTAIRNATGGSEFQFIARNNQPVPGDWSWTLSANTFGGGIFANGAESSNRFRPGTAFIKPVVVANEHGASGNFVTWRDVLVRPVAAGTTAQELAQRVIDLSVVTGGDQRYELSLAQDARPLDAFVWTQELVRVNTAERYDLTAWSINSREQFDRPMGFASLDIDRKLIHPLHVTKFGNAPDTHLAATLSPGDTSILVTDATGWSVSPFESAQTRALAWYGYSDSTGHVYPDFSYTRNVAFDFDRGLWGDGGIAFDSVAGAHRITLTAPWTGPTLAAGSAVRNATSGEVFNQFTIHSTEPAYGWQQFGGMIGSGVWQNGRRDDARFRPGTAFIQPTFAGGEPLAWRDIHIAPRQASFFGDQPAVTFDGQSLVTTSQSLSLLQADQLIPIDPTREFVLSAQALRGAAVSDGSPVNDQHTLGFTSFDSDGQEILPIHVTRYSSATDTTLATALNVGDTTIHLTNASGWSNLGPADTRALAWFGYSNNDGQVYADYSYTRNVAVDRVNGLWDIGAINGNTITLRTPWSGPALAAGSAVRNAAHDERLNAALLDRGTIPNQWTDFSATVSGSWLNGQPQANAFRPGTAFIRPAALLNSVTLSGDDVVSLRNVSVHRSDVLPGSVSADTNHQVSVLVDALANDPLAASVPMRILSVTVPKYGSATIVTGGGPSGRDVVRYLSAPWFIGTDSFEYTAQRLSTGEVFRSRITINFSGTNVAQNSAASSVLTTQGQQVAGNAPPVAADEFGYYAKAYQTSVGQTLVADGVRWNGLLTNEYRSYGISGGQPLNTGALTVRLLSGPEHGTLNLKHDGTFEYSPNPGFVGTDVFRYEVFDGLNADATVAAIDVQYSDQALLQQRLRDLVQGFYDFHDSYSNFTFTGLQPTHFDASKNPYLSWRVHLLPYLGYTELYSQFHLNEPWNSTHNLMLLDRMPDIFRVAGDSATTNTTRFQTISGPGNAYFWRRTNGYLVGPRMADYHFQDGTENTLLVLLAGEDKRVPWTQPADLNFDPAVPVASLGNLPSGRIDGVMVNGSVISLHTDIAPATFLALATMNGNEVVDADQLRRQETLREGGHPAVQSFDAALADSRLGTLGLAMHSYHDTHTYFPVSNNPAWFDAEGKPKLSWRVHLLPYLGHANLYEQFRLDEPWDSANNLPLLNQMPDIFRSAGDAADSVTTRLVTFTGVDAPFLRAKTSGNYYGPRINQFVDGMSNTILIAEAGADRSVLWTKPDDIAFDISQPLAGLGSLADGRIRTLLADGSRLNLGADVSAAMFRALVTPSGHDFADGSTLNSREELRSGVAPRIDADVLNRFKQVGLAMHNFHDVYRKFPIEDLVASYFDAQGKPKLSWRVWILPFMDQQSLFEQFHLDEPWDSPHNLPLLDQMPDVFRHPGDPTDSTTTRVQQFTGPGTPFLSVLLNGRYSSLKISQITDGTSNTLMAVESGADQAVPWTSPDDLPFDPTNPIAAMGQLSEFFVGLFFDGNVRRLSTSISPALLKAYVTHRGGEVISSVSGDISDPSSVAGVTITPADGVLSAVEGQLAVFDAALTKAPAADVVLTIASSSLSVAAVSPPTVRFTSANWHIPQRVTLLAVDDALVDGSQTAMITVAVDDPNSDNSYDALADRMFDFTAFDNDTAGFEITLTDGSTVVSELGTTDTFRVVLTAQPLTDVVIDLSNSDSGEVAVDRTSLTFTPSNWNTPQTVTVSGVDDLLVDGNQANTLTLSIDDAASDDAWDALADRIVSVVTLDDDAPGFSVLATDGSTIVTESGTTDTTTVVLNKAPLSNVVISVGSSDLGEATVSPSTLTFTPANWNVPQSVTITGVDDTLTDGDQTTAIVLSILDANSDNAFDPLPDQTVLVTTLDVNHAPTISDVGDQFGNENTATAPISFTVGDVESAAGSLIVSASSSNPTLVPNGNFVFGGTGANRTLVVTPAAGQSGSVTITLTVSDGVDATSDTFLLTINAAPTISDLSNITTNEDSATAAIPLLIGDLETPANHLTVLVTSLNTTLVPSGNLLVSGSGAHRSLTITPAANANGNATITVTVNDGAITTSESFVLTVEPVNDAPALAAIASVTTSEDTPTDAITFAVGDLETSASLLTLTAASSNTALIPVSGILFSGSGANRTVTLTPAANQNGTASITVTVSDGSLTATRSFDVTVLPINDAPAVSPVADQNGTEATSANVSFVISDLESEAGNLTVSATSSNPALVANSDLTLGGSGATRTLTAIPKPNASGSTTITLTVNDGVATSSHSFVLTIAAVNDAPTISDVGEQVTAEDTSTSALSFTIGDLESSADDLTVIAASSDTTLVPNGNLVLGGSGANRSLTITPAADRFGSATITLTVSDGQRTTSDTFVLTVNAVNDAPTLAKLGNLTMAEDSAASLDLLLGDVETSASELSVTVNSSNATLIPADHLTLNGSGAVRTLLLIPAANQFGSETITVAVSDGLATTTDTFVLTVQAVNDAPTISDILGQSTLEDTALIGVPFVVGDAETPAGSLTVTATSSNGTLVPNGNIVFGGSGANRTLTVTPTANQFGSTQITIRVSDGTASVTGTFELTVTATNDSPTISHIPNASINEDATTPSLTFSVGDLETVADVLTVTATSSDQTLLPDSGIVLGGSGSSRSIRLTPAPDRFGVAMITMTVNDGEQSATSTFRLTVNGVNDAPIISSVSSQTTLEDTPLSPLVFTVGDLESLPESLTVTATSSSNVLFPTANLTLAGTGPQRTLTLTPAPNLSGTANITVRVSDGQTTTSTVFAVTVTPVNDAPVISVIAPKSTAEDTATPAIAFVVSDLETPAGQLVVTASSSNPLLVPSGNLLLSGSGSVRTITAIPAANQFGQAIITVTVSDGLLTTSDSFELTVNAVNDPPSLTDLVNQTIAEDTATAAMPFVIGDLETTADDLTVTATSSNGTLVPQNRLVISGIGANRTLTVSPAPNQFGSATITVQVSDDVMTVSDSFVLTVRPVNDPPTLGDLADQTTGEDTALTIPLSVSDPEMAAGNLKITATSANTTLVPATNIVLIGTGANRSLKITSAANRFGTTTITVRVSDGNTSVSDTFVLTVNAVNDRPTISNITNKTTNEDTATSLISFTIGDVETAAANLIVTANSSNTTLVPHSGLVFSGSGASRTLKATPAANQSGTTTITVTVSDGTAIATDTFLLTVNPVNDPPTISNIPNQTTRRGTQTPAIPFTVSDLETDASKLTVSGSSSNTTLVPNASIIFGGSGSNRTLRIAPAANRTGSATITVRVRDGRLTATDTFVLTVSASSSSQRSASLLVEEPVLVSPRTDREAVTLSSATIITAPTSESSQAESSASNAPRQAASSLSSFLALLANHGTTRTRSQPTMERLRVLDSAFRSSDWIVRL